MDAPLMATTGVCRCCDTPENQMLRPVVDGGLSRLLCDKCRDKVLANEENAEREKAAAFNYFGGRLK